jgi:uncharacterized protein
MIIPEKEDELIDVKSFRKKNQNNKFHTLRIFVTEKCNLNCTYCQINKNSENKTTGIISEKNIEGALKVLKENSDKNTVKTIELTGGEPLLFPKLINKTIENARKLFEPSEFRLVISTNGLLITEKMANFFSENDCLILISLDGLKSIHDKTRIDKFNKGTFDRTIKAYNIFKKAKCKIGVSIVVNTKNVKTLKKITNYVYDELKPQSIGLNHVKYPTKDDINSDLIVPMKEYTRSVYESFRSARKKGVFVEQIHRRLQPFVEKEIRIHDCSAQGSGFNVSPDGFFGPCKTLLMSKDFATKSKNNILKNKVFTTFSKNIPLKHDKCIPCESIGICGGGCLYNSFCKTNKIESFDARDCEMMKEFLKIMIWDLYDIIKHKLKGEVAIRPSKSERKKMFGKIKVNKKDMKSSIGHQLVKKDKLDKFLGFIEDKRRNKDIVNYLKTNSKIPDNKKIEEMEFPKKILLEMNQTCNLRCKMCYISSKENKEIPIKKIKELLQEIKQNKSIVSYSSLEPFMRRNFGEVIESTFDLEIPYYIYSNGTLINESMAELLVKKNPVSITISIHGTEKVHDEITGVKSSFKKSIQAIKYINKYKKKYKKELPFIRVNFSLSNLNQDNLELFIKETRKYEVDLRINYLMWLDESTIKKSQKFLKEKFQTKDLSSGGFQNNHNELDIIKLIKQVNSIKTQKGITTHPSLTNEEVRRWYTDPEFVRSEKCYSPFQTIRIKTNGDITPCPFLDFVYGNIYKSTIKEIWNSKRSKKFRKDFQKIGIFPACKRCTRL